jgi:hypothetical protein
MTNGSRIQTSIKMDDDRPSRSLEDVEAMEEEYIKDLIRDIMNDTNNPRPARGTVSGSEEACPTLESFWYYTKLNKDLIEAWYESLSGTDGLTWEGLTREVDARIEQELQQQNETLRREKENTQTANGSLVGPISHDPSVQPGSPNQDRDLGDLNLQLQKPSFEQEKKNPSSDTKKGRIGIASPRLKLETSNRFEPLMLEDEEDCLSENDFPSCPSTLPVTTPSPSPTSSSFEQEKERLIREFQQLHRTFGQTAHNPCQELEQHAPHMSQHMPVDMRAPPTGPANNVDAPYGRRLSGLPPSHLQQAKLNPNTQEFRPSAFAPAFNPAGPSQGSSPRSNVNSVVDPPVVAPPSGGQLIRRKTKAVDPKKCDILGHLKTLKSKVPNKNWDDNGEDLLDDKVDEKQEQDQEIQRHVEENKTLQREVQMLLDMQQEQGNSIKRSFLEQQQEREQEILKHVEENKTLQQKVQMLRDIQQEQSNSIRTLVEMQQERDQKIQTLEEQQQERDQKVQSLLEQQQEQEQENQRHVKEKKALQRQVQVLLVVKHERDQQIQSLHSSIQEQERDIWRQVGKTIALQREVDQAKAARAEDRDTMRELEQEQLELRENQTCRMIKQKRWYEQVEREQDQEIQRLKQENQQKDLRYNDMYGQFSRRLVASEYAVRQFREELMHQIQYHVQCMKLSNETLEKYKETLETYKQGVLTRDREMETLKQEMQQKDQQQKQQTDTHDKLTAELNQKILTYVQRILERDKEIETLGQKIETLELGMETLQQEIEQDSPSLETMLLAEDDDDEASAGAALI